jgi:putative ABC transport system substrate-binding protein
MATSGDAVGTGLIASLARPGGNVTGMTTLLEEVSVKRLQLLKEAIPRVTRIAVLFNPGNPAFVTDISGTEAAAKSMKVEVQRFGVKSQAEFEDAFAAMTKRRIEAVMVHQDGMLNANSKALAERARKHRLPSIGFKEYGEAGGLIGYGVDFLEMYRRTAYFVDKILKGAKAGDLPIEQPTQFQLVVNLRTAKALGVKVQRAIVQRADRVIE